MKKIIAVHLLNDRSGSPLVFRQALEVLQRRGFHIVLYTATPSGEGFLSNMHGVEMHPILYKHSPAKWKTLLYFLLVQWSLFWKLLFALRRQDTVYINTMLPMGAALAAKLRRSRVVYHIHEVTIRPAALKWVLKTIAKFTAHSVIFVSRYVEQSLGLSKAKGVVVYNALPQSFLDEAYLLDVPNTAPTFTVLMLCSLKTYKGVDTFIELARNLPEMKFEMVLNAPDGLIAEFREQQKPPPNCLIYSSTSNTLPFFKRAHVVVNLSNPAHWVETFGLTLLEAMACGRPVIGPRVGGPAELITHGVEGFCLDAREPSALIHTLRELRADFRKYVRFSENARSRTEAFGLAQFEAGLAEVFEQSILVKGCANTGIDIQKMEIATA